MQTEGQRHDPTESTPPQQCRRRSPTACRTALLTSVVEYRECVVCVVFVSRLLTRPHPTTSRRALRSPPVSRTDFRTRTEEQGEGEEEEASQTRNKGVYWMIHISTHILHAGLPPPFPYSASLALLLPVRRWSDETMRVWPER